jgi:3-dehydroquinate dehydratase-1
MLQVECGSSKVVGSIGNRAVLRKTTAVSALAECDLVEIRLDILASEGALDREIWQHLKSVPLLFTARCKAEGGAMESTATQRAGWIEMALDDAAAIDIEVASLTEMPDVVGLVLSRGVPLIASCHDFSATPSADIWQEKLEAARAAGASVFKAAAMIRQPSDLSALADFQALPQGLPVAMMGMGALAPVSRLLCAQYGSVLNYGYLGEVATAPGQWSAARLKEAIATLEPIRS